MYIISCQIIIAVEEKNQREGSEGGKNDCADSAVLFYIGCSGKASLRKQSEWRTKESEGLKL